MNTANRHNDNQVNASLYLALAFASITSLFNLPLGFIPLILLLALCPVASGYLVAKQYIAKKLAGKIQSVFAYVLLAFGLFLIWQQLEIPSLVAITAVLTLVLWAKVCELKTRRDKYLLWLMASVLIAINALLMPDFQLPIIVTGMLILLLAASEMSQPMSRLTSMRIAGLLSASLPFALILFITLPRINLPMQELGLVMGLPITVEQDKSLGDKGLGKELSFGDIGELSNSDTRVLIADFPGDFELKDGQQLYWRGPVYWRYNNEKWQVRPGFNRRSQRQRNGWGSNRALANMTSHRDDILEYSVVLNPHGEYWLYGLDLPQTLTGESYLSQDYQLLSIRTVDKFWRYKITASLDYQISAKEPQSQLDLGLEYPDANPKILALGRQWREQHRHDGQAILAGAKQYFQQGKFLYANDDYRYQGKDQLDHFLFERKLGHSQHYASALTLLLRAAGVPARLVAGYRGAKQVGLTSLYVVNEHHAHVWVEAWLGQGEQRSWQRIDPALWLEDLFGSTEKPQDKYQQDLDEYKQVLNTENTVPANRAIAGKKQKAKQKKSAASWLDSLSQWTLEFDADKQTELANKLGVSKLLWWQLLLAGIGLLLCFALAYFLILRRLSRGKAKAVHIQLYHKLCAKLAKQGCQRLPYEGAKDYFERCAHLYPLRAEQFNRLKETYLPLCYANLDSAQRNVALKRFGRQVKQAGL